MTAALEQIKFHEHFVSSMERDAFMFDKEFMSDCAFVIQDGDNTIKIPCHKYVLGCSSWEFYNLFYIMQADSIYIPISHYSCDVVKMFLEFVYKETTQLDMKTVWDILKLAKRFGVKKLLNFCGNFLSKNVTEENLIQIIEKSTEFEIEGLLRLACIKVIGRSKPDFFKSTNFFKLSKDGLNNIFKSDFFDKQEIQLFRSANIWAENNCAENEKSANAENKRLALGDVVNNIRFATMSINEFSGCTKNESILTAQQIVDIFNCITSNGEYECQFSSVLRLPTINHILFARKRKSIDDKTTDFAHVNPTGVFKFSVNDDKVIIGFGLYGTIRDSEKLLFLQVKCMDTNVIIHQSTKYYIFDGSNKIHNCFLKKSISLEKDKEYAIIVRWSCFERFYCLRNAKKIYTDNHGVKISIHGPCHNFALLILQ